MRQLAHIVSPVLVDDSSDLFVAQPITFETMKIAREFAKDRVNVRLLSAQYSEDRAIVPSHIEPTKDLHRSVLDTGSFKLARKLPLVRDILDRLNQAAPSADYLIYTNVDISLMPQFYLVVHALIGKGYDAFAINRRTISTAHTRLDEIPMMFAEAGEPHPGYDCFVFRREVYSLYQLGNICVGAAGIGIAMLLNLFCNARRFAVFGDLHTTFHLGHDRVWKNPALKDYRDHNADEFRKSLRYYETANPHAVEKYRSLVAERVGFAKQVLHTIRSGAKRLIKG